MKKYIILLCFLFILCTSSIHLQPHISSASGMKLHNADAGIFISSEDLAFAHEQFNFLLGGKARVPLGTPLKEMALETFAPFFNKVLYIGRKDYEVTPYVIEVNIKDFQITQGFDTYLVIRCQVSTEDDIVFFDEFAGSGKGTAAAGLFDDKGIARDQIRKSAEAAFIEAFENMQRAFIQLKSDYQTTPLLPLY